MIKVAIAGAATPLAGDIIRILINHTDARIVELFQPGSGGVLPESVHYGLTGEDLPAFSAQPALSQADVLFICEDIPEISGLTAAVAEELRVIDCRHFSAPAADKPYGLSEVNRKALVRGARKGVLPSPQGAVALIGLYPLAANMLLNHSASLVISQPSGFTPDDEHECMAEIERFLQLAQPSFVPPLSTRFVRRTDDMRPWIEANVVLSCSLSEKDALNVYDRIYDDHNFTFLTARVPAPSEVLGTQKCMVSLLPSSGDELSVRVIADGSMRGHAGDAVHMMNLLFGLHEQTGLRLKTLSPDYIGSGKNDRS